MKNEQKGQKERDKYMKTTKKGLETPHKYQEGLERPRTVGYNKLKLGLILFYILIFIVLGLLFYFDVFGLYS